MIEDPQFLRSEWYVLVQALAAVVLGGLIGWEREAAGKWAGFRTHMLVCLAAMLFIRLGEYLILKTSQHVESDILRADPIRILEAIMTGVAFLGAGTIFGIGAGIVRLGSRRPLRFSSRRRSVSRSLSIGISSRPVSPGWF